MMAPHAASPEVDLPLHPPAMFGPPQYIEIETRFGHIAFKTERAIEMPFGLPGFPGRRLFGLNAIPNSKLDQVMLLQDLDDAKLGFLVLPLPIDNTLIETDDITEALDTLDLSRGDAALLLIVTVRQEQGGAVTSVNLRAPIFLDTKRRVARQFVIPSNKYAIRHAI